MDTEALRLLYRNEQHPQPACTLTIIATLHQAALMHSATAKLCTQVHIASRAYILHHSRCRAPVLPTLTQHHVRHPALLKQSKQALHRHCLASLFTLS